MPAPEPEGLAHVLVELSRQTERLAALDTREAEHFQAIAAQLQELGTALTAVEGTLNERQSALEVLDGLSGRLNLLSAKLDEVVPDEDGDPKIYRPGPAPRWWKLTGPERDQAITRLRGWIEQIYRPQYGHLATLGACWEQHPLCLFTLDWLMELWSVLYLQRRRGARDLAGQAEFQTRLLPAASEQMAVETARCEHVHGAPARKGQRVAS